MTFWIISVRCIQEHTWIMDAYSSLFFSLYFVAHLFQIYACLRVLIFCIIEWIILMYIKL